MPSIQYPNSGIYGGWSRGEHGWGDQMNSNLLLTDALLHAVVKSKINTIPTTVNLGDLYLVDTINLSTELENKENHLILFKSTNINSYIDITPQIGNKIYLLSNNTSYIYKSSGWVELITNSFTDSSEEKSASAKLTYELKQQCDNLADQINNKTSVGDGNIIINGDLNNLQTTGKYFIHIIQNVTKNPPINITSDWWIDVYVYGNKTNKKIMQEGRMHGATASSANAGPANLLVRCYDNGKWGPWQYSYAQFSS